MVVLKLIIKNILLPGCRIVRSNEKAKDPLSISIYFRMSLISTSNLRLLDYREQSLAIFAFPI